MPRFAKWYGAINSRKLHRYISSPNKITEKKSLGRRGREIHVSRLLGVADDDSGTLFAEYTSFFGLGAPVPTFLATEEAEHAGGFFCT